MHYCLSGLNTKVYCTRFLFIKYVDISFCVDTDDAKLLPPSLGILRVLLHYILNEVSPNLTREIPIHQIRRFKLHKEGSSKG